MPEAAAALPFVSAGAQLLGSAGQGEGSGPTSINGFASQPKQVQDLMLNEILPQIVAQARKPFTTIPTRPASPADYDPVFGSKAVQNLQGYFDAKANAAKDVTPGATNVPAPIAASPSGGNYASPSSNPLQGTMYQNWKGGSQPQQQITSSDPGFSRYIDDLGSAYSKGTPLPSTQNYIGNGASGISGLSSTDVVKLRQMLAGFQGGTA